MLDKVREGNGETLSQIRTAGVEAICQEQKRKNDDDKKKVEEGIETSCAKEEEENDRKKEGDKSFVWFFFNFR